MDSIQMDIVVGNKFLRSSPAERARLLGTVRTYVTNDQFVNLVTNIDVNDKKGTQIKNICSQLAAFNSLSQLWDNVELWLGS
jgi:hypothetical protein